MGSWHFQVCDGPSSAFTDCLMHDTIGALAGPGNMRIKHQGRKKIYKNCTNKGMLGPGYVGSTLQKHTVRPLKVSWTRSRQTYWLLA